VPGEIPELVLRQADQRLAAFCEARVPPNVRHAVRLSYVIEGNTATLVEERAPWRGSSNTAWTSSPIARFRYDHQHGQWTLYWRDRDQGWHLFPEARPTPYLGDLIDVVDADPTDIFWG
jgi:hypothetical protein